MWPRRQCRERQTDGDRAKRRYVCRDSGDALRYGVASGSDRDAVSLPLIAFPTRRVGYKRKQLKRRTQEKMAEFVGLLSETLSVSGHCF
jgi:hypothetical protein